jgi:hypothetical protein
MCQGGEAAILGRTSGCEERGPNAAAEDDGQNIGCEAESSRAVGEAGWWSVPFGISKRQPYPPG